MAPGSSCSNSHDFPCALRRQGCLVMVATPLRLAAARMPSSFSRATLFCMRLRLAEVRFSGVRVLILLLVSFCLHVFGFYGRTVREVRGWPGFGGPLPWGPAGERASGPPFALPGMLWRAPLTVRVDGWLVGDWHTCACRRRAPCRPGAASAVRMLRPPCR